MVAKAASMALVLPSLPVSLPCVLFTEDGRVLDSPMIFFFGEQRLALRGRNLPMPNTESCEGERDPEEKVPDRCCSSVLYRVE